MAKLQGVTDGKYFVASVSHHDCRVLNGLMADGGQPGLQGWGGYTRFSVSDKVWAEVKESWLDLYIDYHNVNPRQFGIWKVEDIRILDKEEIPNILSVEWLADNWLWRKENGELVMLKDCSNEHLENILKLDHVCGDSNLVKITKYLLSSREPQTL